MIAWENSCLILKLPLFCSIGDLFSLRYICHSQRFTEFRMFISKLIMKTVSISVPSGLTVNYPFFTIPFFLYFQRSAADVNIGTMSFSFSQALISETCPLTQPMGSDGQSQVKYYQNLVSRGHEQLLQYHTYAYST